MSIFDSINKTHVPADVPEDAKSEYAKYTKAVERQNRRDVRMIRWIAISGITSAVAVVVSFFGVIVASSTNLELTKVAMQQPVRYVERGATDGIDRVIAVRNTMDADKGREMETVQWFVTWSRWVSGEEAVTKMHRKSARAKLAGQEAISRFEGIIAKDECKPEAGCVRDVLGVVVAEQDIPGLEEGKRNYQLSWQEKTLRNGRVTSDMTMTQNITIVQGPPRDGALDGVNIILLTEPTPHIKQRIASAN